MSTPHTTVHWAGVELRLLPDPALWWPAEATVFIADLHLGKAASFRALGQPVPGGTTRDNLQRLDALIAATGARGHAVGIGGELFSDAMGRPGTYEGTYIGMLDHNLTTIACALGASPPPPRRGMQGLLAEPAK